MMSGVPSPRVGRECEMVNMLLAFVVAFGVSALSGLFIIPMLRKFKMKQMILEVGPKWHMSKQGTPMMGGLMFILGTGVACTVFGLMSGRREWLYIFVYAALNAVIGLLDDIAKVKRKANKGLSVLQKLFLQLAFSSAYIAVLHQYAGLTTGLKLPFFGTSIELPWIVFLILGVLYNTFIINAVNLTDGIDGLCTGTTLPIAALFAVVAMADRVPELGIYPAALLGGLLGFLVYNFHPAKVFMGDTGSLFIGGSVVGMAYAFDWPLVLLICALFFILEAVSVVLQVGYFKLTHGKRIFKMTPIHHHFEMSGWSEIKLFTVFTVGTGLLCLLAFFGIN